MKIILVSAVPPPEGGIATWTKEFMAFCRSKNIGISLVNTALIGVRENNFNSKTTIHDELARTRSIIKSMRLATKGNSIDVVHINSSCSAKGLLRDYICARIAKKHSIPIVLHCHCNVRDAVTSKFAKFVLKKITTIASKILVLNTDSSRCVMEITGAESKIVPNFISESLIHRNRIINKEIKEVVYIGHVQKEKGCCEIIKAAEQIPEKHFTLVGPVEDEICERSISKNILLTGEKPYKEAQEHLKKADVFLFPSHTEGFSLSLLEAMASGLPCVATTVGSNVDMLEGLGGIIIPPKDTTAIVDAIKAIENHEIRKDMSEWNINKVKKCYTIERVANSIFEEYQEIQK